MTLYLTLNHNRTLGFSTEWIWKGKNHNVPGYVGEGRGETKTLYYGFFWITKHADAYDYYIYYKKIGNLQKLYNWNGCKNKEEYIQKYIQWLTPKRLKQFEIN